MRTDSIACDSHSLEYRVGVTFKDGTVHERSGVTLVGVTYNVLCVVNLICRKLPLSACGEASASASAKSACENEVNNVLGLHVGKNLTKSLIAVCSDIFINIFGVYNTAVSERNALLLLIESCVGKSNCIACMILANIIVNESFNDSTLKEMLLNDFGNILSLNTAIESTLGVNDHNRAECAKTEASCLNDLDFFGKTLRFKLCCKCICYCYTSGRSTACTCTNQYMRTYHFIILRLN